eukprot:gene12511-12645_t
MGKHNKKPLETPNPGCGLGKRSGGLSLDLTLAGKKTRTNAQSLQPKQLVDQKGTPTIEGIRTQTEGWFQDLLNKIEKNTAALANSMASAEASIHKQAKADHAMTCQMLQDSQAAIDLAGQQHEQALKQIAAVSKVTLAALEATGKTASNLIKDVQGQYESQIKSLRSRAGIN